MSLQVVSKTEQEVSCEVVDGGELKSRRHLNVRGKSATLPSITGNKFESWYLKDSLPSLPKLHASRHQEVPDDCFASW